MHFDDPIVEARLRAFPELLTRLYEFVQMYNLVERPALILQARPVIPEALPPLELDEQSIRSRFSEGSGTDANRWWDGFKSSFTVSPTFHGIGVISARSEPKWASEMHWDGHFVAGTWNFDERQHRGRDIKAVAEFHAEAFGDLFSIVKRNIPSDAAEYYFTATLWQASSLHYLGLADFGRQYVIQHEPLAMKNLQWQVQKVSIGAPDYEAQAKMMGAALPAAYRDRRTNRKTGRAI